ncbi:MAG: zinc ribbon domain-containing protein [Deltaproteobacteria bacterium]|nr:zinc ribbon domain-containing protein [Deltaproteobacteria bacterium]
MPIYEFRCKKCKNEFEVLFRSNDEKQPVVCPACKSKKTERLMSAFAGGKSGCSSCATTSCSTS